MAHAQCSFIASSPRWAARDSIPLFLMPSNCHLTPSRLRTTVAGLIPRAHCQCISAHRRVWLRGSCFFRTQLNVPGGQSPWDWTRMTMRGTSRRGTTRMPTTPTLFITPGTTSGFPSIIA